MLSNKSIEVPDNLIKLVKKILIDIAKSCDLVSKDFDPRVRFRQFGDSSLNFELLCWIEKPEYRGRTIDFLNTQIYNSFNKKENIYENCYCKRN